MCLSDPDTAILIGGETSDRNHCRDSLWKLELGQRSFSDSIRTVRGFFLHLNANYFLSDVFSDSDFWFPLDSSASGPVPPSAQGHSATYDPDSKSVFVYGGLRQGLRYSDVYVLNTVNWKWKLIAVGYGKYLFILVSPHILDLLVFCFMTYIGQREGPQLGSSLGSVL